MKKRFIPATVAALTLSFSSIAVPQAVAESATINDQQISYPDTVNVQQGELILAQVSGETSGITFALEDGAPDWVTIYPGSGQVNFEPTAETAPGLYEAVVVATAGDEVETVTITATVTRIPVTITGTATEVEPTRESQSTGITVANHVEETEISAVDEDGANIPVAIDGNGLISVTPGVDVDGPITLTITDATLEGGAQSSVIPVDGHEADRDDNDSDVVITGTAVEVEPTAVPQFTGLTIANNDDETEISAVDEDGANIPVAIGDDGRISVTPGVDVDGPITLTITDATLEGGAQSSVIPVDGHEADRDDNDSEVDDPSSIGSIEGSSVDDANWGLIGLGGVLAAVIGVIAAIGGGFIPLPPALANMIPFL